MLRDLKFSFELNEHIFKKVLKVDIKDFIENKDYQFQIFNVLSIHYDAFLIDKKFIEKESLINYLKNYNKNVELHFIFNRKKIKESKIEII